MFIFRAKIGPKHGEKAKKNINTNGFFFQKN